VARPLVVVGGAVLGLVAVLVASRRALDVVEVEGSSMAPALQPGDRLLVEAVTYRFRPPLAGDVVLALDPREPSRELIKRVAAVDGSAGTIVLAGDAPHASTDSRSFGPVPLAAIRWRVAGRYWPPGGSRSWQVGAQ
jgi:nickel-type superoxide dismutase maturation protease